MGTSDMHMKIYADYKCKIKCKRCPTNALPVSISRIHCAPFCIVIINGKRAIFIYLFSKIWKWGPCTDIQTAELNYRVYTASQRWKQKRNWNLNAIYLRNCKKVHDIENNRSAYTPIHWGEAGRAAATAAGRAVGTTAGKAAGMTEGMTAGGSRYNSKQDSWDSSMKGSRDSSTAEG